MDALIKAVSELAKTFVEGAPIIVGTLFAAFLGAYLGFRGFRKERSYEARREWHREFAETCGTFRNRAGSLHHFLGKGAAGRAHVKELALQLSQLVFRFQDLAVYSSLYAEPDTHAAVARVFKDLDSLKFELEKDESLLAASLGHLDLLYQLLARDMRSILDLPPLPEHSKLSDR